MRCSLTYENGQARLRLGDEIRAPLLYSTGRVLPDQIRLFAELGVHVFSFNATADHHLYRLAAPVWRAPNVYDYEELDARVATILDADPEGWVMPRVYTCSPPWWDVVHHDDLVVWDDGSTETVLLHGANKRTVPSLASPTWRAASLDNVARLVQHLEAGPFAGRIAGYVVTSLNSEEWFHWGTMEHRGFDYSPVAIAAWRTWLTARYGSDDALSDAYGQAISITTVLPPSLARKRRHATFTGLDPRSDRDVIDHALFLSDLVADTIVGLAQRVKLETNGRKLFGTFFGYLPELAFHPDALRLGGHLAFERVVSNPAVDFIASPTSYARRGVGEGHSLSMVPTRSVALRGKVLFHENDVRTHRLHDDAGYGRTEDGFESATIQRREMAFALTEGQGMWWFDMTGGWYDDPVVKDALKRLVSVAERTVTLPRENVAEVALVIDREGLLHVEAPPNQWIQLLSTQCQELARTGAPFEVVLLEDVEQLPNARLLIMASSFLGDEAHRERLRHLTAKHSTLWILAPLIAGGGPEVASEVTGVPVMAGEAPELMMARTMSGDVFGTHHWFATPWHPTGDDVEFLAHFVESGRPAVGMTSNGTTWAAFSGVAAVGASILIELQRRAGVHRYVDTDDATRACSRFVALHARDAGVRHLAVPKTDVLYDVLHGVEVKKTSGVFPVYLARGETALFFRGTAAAWCQDGDDGAAVG